MANPSVDQLRQAAFLSVAECRESLKHGRSDLSGLEGRVRDYCQAVTQLPVEEGRRHEDALKALMLEVESLNGELAHAQEAIRSELAGLGRIKQANVAYHKSYAVGPVTIPKKEEE